jgi:acetyl-CoA/propionyl-CoA carboxylase biotin carboxyl carrier protein
MFSTVLIANRGEIAVRISQTLRRLGIRSAAVFSDLDEGSLHVRSADLAVRIGPAAPALSYLSVERILAAAEQVGADAIHPGYGFLSEAPELAQACLEAGIAFIGPPPEVIELMGDKIRAKQAVALAGVPTVPGRSDRGLTDADLIAATAEVGFPVLLKPSAGGGGKGMRLIEGPGQLEEQIASARREAGAAFGDDTLFLERYLPRARHLEVQILADTQGNVVHLGERECSLQRRHQKIIEEAPSPVLDEEQRAELGAHAVAVAKASGYVNAGTVEFIVESDDPSKAYFMEMNARLQVEHPVTEMVWGLDLVEEQLRVAAGLPLAFSQEELRRSGWAIEARVYAEDPTAGFLPTGGRILRLSEPAASLARVDSGVSEGDHVGSTYDPMLAKVIAHGASRPEALARLVSALDDFELLGVTTNVAFLRDLLQLEPVAAGDLDTGLVERESQALAAPHPSSSVLAVAAVLALLTSSSEEGVWDLSGWRLGGRARSSWRAHCEGVEYQAGLQHSGDAWIARLEDGGERQLRVERLGTGFEVELEGSTSRCSAVRDGRSLWIGAEGRVWHFVEPELVQPGERTAAGVGAIASPMPGVVTSVRFAVGDQVEVGETVVIVEAMKMEHSLASTLSGRVAQILVGPGDQVSLGQVVVEIEGDEEDVV